VEDEEGYPTPKPTRGSGKRRKLPQWGSGAENDFHRIWRPKTNL